MDSKNGVVGLHTTSSRTCGSFTKRRPEDGDGRDSTTEECDSTTESVNYRVGEEVLVKDGDDLLFGTVGLIHGKRTKIIYDDGTEKWSTINRLKKLSPISPVKEEVEEVKVNSFPSSPPLPPLNDSLGSGSSSKKKSNKCDVNGQAAPKESHQTTCGSCGTQKIITRKKAMDYSPYTSHQYNCRKCINKSKTSKNNGVPIMAAAHYLAANSRQRPRTSETNGGMDPNKARMLENGMANGVVFRSESDICLHCRKQITEKVSLHCTMCERPCHPSCLTLTPPPLSGDIFWSIICHVCGTQKHNDSPENDSQKLYSSRRSISSWSDVAYLLLSCLGCKNPTEKFFDLDKQIIPFWEENVNGLHLPRQYKTAQDSDRRNNLLLALTNASLRFLKDDKKKSESWSIKENTTRGIQMWKTIKPPIVSAGRGVTAAGFPISVRASNPEAASVAMSNIAQTIATQAAANKANNQGVPTPKNSPSHISPKSSTSASLSSLKSSGAPIGPALGVGKKGPKDGIPVAKKTGSELNNGVQWKNNIWPQSKYSGTKFLADLPKTNINAVLGNHPVGESTSNNNPPPLYPTVGPTNRLQQIQQQQQQKHTAILQPSPGGAARVTGMIMHTVPSSTSSSSVTSQAAEVNNRVGSYPVRKNGSPQLSKSIRVEPVERKKEVELSSTSSFSFGGDNNKKSEEFIRESPGFNNQSNQPRQPAKRKLSLPAKPPTESCSASTSQSRTDEHELTSVAKKVKLSLPSSTDVTSKRLPSAPDSSGNTSNDSSNTNISQKRDRSPLQRLTDLLRIGNGVLTIARVKQTEYGTQSEPLIPSTLADAMDQSQGVLRGRTDALASLTYDKAGQGFTSPIKNSSIGATPSLTNGPSSSTSSSVQEKREENTKDKNVTTSPRVFKHASVSTPGASPSKASSPVAERRMRPVRLKRAVVTNAQAEKQSKESSADAGAKVGKKVNGKTSSVAAVAAAALSHAAKTRGRPKKIFRQLVARRPVGNINNGFLGQFNGSVDNKIEGGSTDTVNESEFTWGSSTIKDLVEHGHGYRLGVLPRVPEGKIETEEVRQSAIKHIREELAPRPPSYWSTSSTLNHSKKSANQRSRKDLKDVDSYYISGCRKDASGVQYQVVWRDGQGFECSSDDEEEMGIEFGSEYMYFEDYDFMEYFFDKMPVVSNVEEEEEDDCDIDMERGGETSGVMEARSSNGEVAAAVKAEPSDAERATKNGKKWTEKELRNVIREETEAQSLDEPIIIDLTDSP